jgi:ANTAR domain
MTVAAGPGEALRALVERADRARAQAIANHANLEQTISRARTLDLSSDCRFRRSERPSSEAEARINELQETVEGLMKRLESQGPIEQAKGIIMAQTRCDPDQAFEILRRASQRSNTKLRVLADELVARTAAADHVAR